MCSVNDEIDCEDLLPTKNISIQESKTCRSCENPSLVVLRGKDVYCRNCFLYAATHKFRAALGKSKMMKPNDKVLVAYAGCKSSSALLHMLHSGVTESSHKKLLFDVVVLYIDEGAVLNKNEEEREKIVSEIKETVTGYNFILFVISLGEYFNEQLTVGSSLKINKELDKRIKNLFENIKSMTSKEDMLRLIKQYLILKCANQLNCNKAFTAEVGTDLAIKLLSDFSLGRGEQAAFDTGFCDSRQSVRILRPLRDFTRKEIFFYNKFHDIKEVIIPSMTTLSNPNISIRKLTEKFVSDLQENFPSTVYTVFRTGEKLSVNDSQASEICLLCGDKVRTNSEGRMYTAVDAANFSRNISSKSNCGAKEGGCCGACSGEKGFKIDRSKMAKFLCYGCNLIVKEIENVDCLPSSLLHLASKKSDFNSMREQISEFLIEDSPEV